MRLRRIAAWVRTGCTGTLPWIALVLGLAAGLARADSDVIVPARSQPAASATQPALAGADEPVEPLTGPQASALLREIADDLPRLLSMSRPLLLGQRDPTRGPSCVIFTPVGRIRGLLPPLEFSDASGGCGLRMSALYLNSFARGRTPMKDFAWHQGVFRLVLSKIDADNAPVQQAAELLAGRANRLAAGTHNWQELPDGLALPPAVGEANDWLTYCLSRAVSAGGARDAAEAHRWADELASAAFSLADLHRWLGLLARSQLTAIDFQAKCQSLFEASEGAYRSQYSPLRDIGFFPGGGACLRGVDNYLEVERQAERLFRVPAEWLQVVQAGGPMPAAARWVPPHTRRVYVELAGSLSAGNRATWEAAPRTPYERSYLANMLFRASEANVIPQLAVVLKRFDAAHPRGTVQELMSVLSYRGGDSYAGLEWGDRFDPRLMDLAGKLTGSDEEVLLAARETAHRIFGGFENYSPFPTLRQALTERKMDCIRATDLVGALYRNAGRPSFCSIRWCGGTQGHTIGGARVDRNGVPTIVLADALADEGNGSETWPSAFFRGHAWPSAYFRDYPDVYTVEQTVRGLDSYLWLQGYIVRGPNAGLLMQASIPQYAGRSLAAEEKVFGGPYPPAARYLPPIR